MLYNFMELPNQTIISHSEILNRNDKEQVKVYIEKPIYGGFATAKSKRRRTESSLSSL